MTFTERPDYNGETCWQYDIRVRNRAEDLAEAGLTEEGAAVLRTGDFETHPIWYTGQPPTPLKRGAIDFIKRHEWLGTVGKSPTHYFGSYLGDTLAGVTIFSLPNHQSEQDFARLIARGACISWSPKNLASHFLRECLDMMVHDTHYRQFIAYADPTARELGSIYQGLGFYYLGLGHGTSEKVQNPWKPEQWVTTRYFRLWRTYRRVAADEPVIDWQEDWHHATGMYWDRMPDETRLELRARALAYLHAAPRVKTMSKHKYAFVLGTDKRETRDLRRKFEDTHKTFPYPKNRGE